MMRKGKSGKRAHPCCVEFKLPGGPVALRDYNPIPISPDSGQRPPTEAKLLPQRKQMAGMD